MKKDKVSSAVIRRLPRYYRHLNDLYLAGVERISSNALGKSMGLTASQIRQDLSCFGGFGQQGYGYMVDQLCGEIGSILGLQHGYEAILIGAGNLGQAIASHMDFTRDGFRLTGIFDSSAFKIGSSLNGVEIQDISRLEEFCRKNDPQMAILCIPREAASEIVERLYSLGIRNFWNFSHTDISVKYPDTIVENVHLNDSLMTLCYRVHDKLQHTAAPEKK